MLINQGSDKAIINWNSFSIGSGEAVRFIQPGSSSVVLNRVTGIDPSVLNGLLSGNGRVFLINPNGITVGPSGVINVGAFMASTMNISNEDFMSGNYHFKQDMDKPAEAGKPLSYIINNGIINADEFAVLSAPAVLNTGDIKVSGLPAVAGKVYLTSSGDLVLNFAGDELIGFTVDGAIKDEILNSQGEAFDANIKNTGTISAEGGEVILSARTAYDVVKSVVNNEGIIEATSIVNKNGVIILDGGDSGIVSNSGTLDVSQKAYSVQRTVYSADDTQYEVRGTMNGLVKVLGEYVGLYEGSIIDASGENGGGTVLIGGDFQGKNPNIHNAFRTYVAPDAVINADAITTGNGGKVIVWADDVTRNYGNISARGGSVSGDGGFAEISGKQYLDFQGTADLRSPNGVTGTLLLDPKNITIATIQPPGSTDRTGDPNDDNLDSYLDNPSETSWVTPATIVGWLGSAAVVLEAQNDITLSNDITTAATNALTMRAERRILINANITTNGAITLVAHPGYGGITTRDLGDGYILMADNTTINAGSGNITVNLQSGTWGGAGDVTIENLTTTGNILVANSAHLFAPCTGTCDILRASADSLISGNTVALRTSWNDAPGNIGTLAEPIRVTTNNLSAFAVGNIYVNSPTQGVTIGGAVLGSITGISTDYLGSNGLINVSAAGNLAVSEAVIANGSGTVDLNAGTGIFSNTATIASGTGNITITADTVNLSNTITTTGAGNITLKPTTLTRTIGLSSATGGFNLTNTELGYLTSTGTVTIGASGGSGAFSFSDLAAINLSAGGYNLTLNGGDMGFLGDDLFTAPTNKTLTLNGGWISGWDTALSDIKIGGASGTLIINATDFTAGNFMIINVANLGASTLTNNLWFSNQYTGIFTITGNITAGGAGFGGSKASIQMNANSGTGTIINGDLLASGAAIGLSSAGTITLNNNITTGNVTVADTAGNDKASSLISLGAVTGISGTGILTSGSASITGADAGGTDTVNTGITLNVTGAGNVGLSGANALTSTGNATCNAATTCTATAGAITITADRVNNGTASTALDVSLAGTASGGSTNNAPALTITTDGGAGSLGEIYITSGEALRLGVLNTADLTSQNISILTTGSAALTWSGASSLDTDAVTLGGAATGALTVSAAQTMGSLIAQGSSFNNTGGTITTTGDISVTTDTITVGAAIDAGAGNISLKPSTPARHITLNDNTATVEFDLSSTELGYLASSGTVIIGRSDVGAASRGNIDLTSIGAIDLSAENFSLTLYGKDLVLRNSLTLNANKTLTFDVASGNDLYGNGVTIGDGTTGTLKINSIGDFSGASGADRFYVFVGNIGDSNVCSSGCTDGQGLQIRDDGVDPLNITGNIVSGATVKIRAEATLIMDAAAVITLNGSVTGASAILGPSGATINGQITNSGSTSLTVQGSGQYLNLGATSAINGGSQALALTANTIALGGAANSIQGTGAVTLQPFTTTRAVSIAGVETFDLTTTEILTLKNGFSSITIGRSNSTGGVTIGGPVTFYDPVTIQSPSGGNIAVNGQITGSGNASVTLNSAGTTTLNADIVTAGNAISIQDPVTVGTPATVTLNTTSGAPAGNNISITGAVDDNAAGTSSLVLNAGTGGTVTLSGAVGGTTALNLFTVSSAARVYLANVIANNIDVTGTTISPNDVTYTALTDDIRFAGAVYIEGGSKTITMTSGGGSGDNITFTSTVDEDNANKNLVLNAGSGDVNIQGNVGAFASHNITGNQVDLANVTALYGVSVTGTNIDLNGTAYTSSLIGPITFTGPVDLDAAAGNITITGGIAVTPNIVFNNTINDPNSNNTLVLNAPAGTVSLNGAVGNTASLSALTLTNSAGAIFGGAVSAGTVTLTNTTGNITFNGALTATTLNTGAQGYNVALNAGGTITNAVTFSNTGAVTLGNGAGDNLAFTGGVTATAPSSKSIAGTVSAAGTGVINLGTTGVNVTANSTVGGTSTGQITLGNATLSDGVTLTAGAGAATPITTGTISGTGGGTASNVTFNTTGAISAGTIATDIGAVTITNASNATLGAVTTSGAFTQSAGSGTTTFGGTVTAGGNVNVTTNTIALNSNINAGANTVTLTTAGNIDGAGTITANSATINASTIGLATEPTMDVATLGLTLTAQVGGWSGKMIKGGSLINPNNVTVSVLGIPLVFGGVPQSVSITGLGGWGATMPTQQTSTNTGSYTNSYLTPFSAFLDKLRAIRKNLLFASSRMQLEEEEDIINIPDEAQSIDELAVQQ
jgi:filamentous hemagglutinin family protein